MFLKIQILHVKTANLHQQLIPGQCQQTSHPLEIVVEGWCDDAFNKLLSHQENPASQVSCGEDR